MSLLTVVRSSIAVAYRIQRLLMWGSPLASHAGGDHRAKRHSHQTHHSLPPHPPSRLSSRAPPRCRMPVDDSSPGQRGPVSPATTCTGTFPAPSKSHAAPHPTVRTPLACHVATSPDAAAPPAAAGQILMPAPKRLYRNSGPRSSHSSRPAPHTECSPAPPAAARKDTPGHDLSCPAYSYPDLLPVIATPF